MFNTGTNTDGALYACSVLFSSVFLHVSLQLIDIDQMEQYHRKLWGHYLALVRREEEMTMAELFEEKHNVSNNLDNHSLLLWKRCISNSSSTVAVFVFEFTVVINL